MKQDKINKYNNNTKIQIYKLSLEHTHICMYQKLVNAKMNIYNNIIIIE